jgi:hypothetical protein
LTAGRYFSRGEQLTVLLGRNEAVIGGAGNNAGPVTMRFGDNHADPEAIDRLPFHLNFFVNSDPAEWRTGAPAFGSVRYRNVYRGIDLVYHGSTNRLEFDFIVVPGADYNNIRLRFDNVDKARLASNGDLVLATPAGELRYRKPVAYQNYGSRRKLIASRFVLKKSNEVAFSVAHYDRKRTLVIDPVLSYSSYLGGTGSDSASAIAVGANGSAYVAGTTTSLDFAVTPQAWQSQLSVCSPCESTNTDIFVAQFDATGKELVYATYLGGNGTDSVMDLALDAAGNVYLTGSTKSVNFPTTPGAYGSATGALEVFVTKLNVSGTALVYSTVLGTGTGYGIAVGTSGNAYITGHAAGEDFPTTGGAFQPASQGSGDAFVSQLNASGTLLVYSTLLGGAGDDYGRAIVLDTAGQATLTGHTTKATAGLPFPVTPGAYSQIGAGADAFVARFNAAGTALVYSTLLGGSNDDFAYGVAVDPQANAYVTGVTASHDFPTTAGAFQRTAAKGFVTKINAAGSGLVYSTYLGSNDSIFYCADLPAARPCGGGFAIAIDTSGRAYVTGSWSIPAGSSAQFTTSDALQPSAAGPSDAFLVQLDVAGSSVLYSTFLGGANADVGQDIAIDNAGGVYIAGTTGSSNWPLANSYDPTYGGNTDGFVANVNMSPASCSYVLSENSRTLPAAGGTGAFTLTTSSGCSWTAVVPDIYKNPWTILTSPPYGSGAAQITYSVNANNLTTQRTTRLVVAKQTFTITQAPLTCTYSLTTGSATTGSAGGAGSFGVTAPAGCTWTTSSSAPWITITAGASGAGPGTVSYVVSANTGAARSGIISTGGQTFTVSQASVACAYSLPSTSISVGSGGGTGSFAIEAPAGCSWSASETATWLTITNGAAGSGTGTIGFTVAANSGPPRAGLIAAGGLSFTVSQTGQDSTPPFGSVDVPLNNSTGLVGAVGISGWALDNGEVTKVSIWRDPLQNEPRQANGLVYIADAVFVDNARPDVEQSYPGYVFNRRAGWGMQILTNMLPNANGQPGTGNGTYRIHVIAEDTAGNKTTLGVRTITCTNAAAAKPFGTLDTPVHGSTVSGYIPNWGWVLTPQPYAIPADASTIWVFIDGMSVGHPLYNLNRPDIATLFPGYQNTNGAVGVHYIDTTQLSNGIHSIAWSVTDTGGRTEGIGSRLFNVNNLVGSTMAIKAPQALARASAKRKTASDGVYIRTGYDPFARLSLLSKTNDSFVVPVRHMDRVELHLPFRGEVRGCLVRGDECTELPVGSTLDAAGVFYWQLDPAFFGAYEIRFSDGDDFIIDVSVRVAASAE